MDFETVHAILVSAHALAGIFSFVIGCAIIFSRKHFFDRRSFSLYLWCLTAMVVFLAGAILIWWAEYTMVEHVAFSGLFILAVYMAYRAFEAHSLVKTQRINRKSVYLDHIGFTLIALFEGFLIVTAINLRSPKWLIALIAVVGVIAGRWTVGMAANRQGM